VRDEFDLDPHTVKKLIMTHRNLEYNERVVDSNERELKAALLLLESCGPQLANQAMTLHFDNQNAAIICTKGSPKLRLQSYAEQIFETAEKYNLDLTTVWIPRDLNNVADVLSKTVDYHDYSVTNEFYDQVCDYFGIRPDIDCFANNENRKTDKYFSLMYCPGTSGVDCFNYNWRLYGICWLFPPVRLIGRTLSYLEACHGEAVLLVPEWRNAYFFPMINTIHRKNVKGKVIFDGSNIFKHGADKSSFFGPGYRGNVVCIWLKY
jgi:hypothetical protein